MARQASIAKMGFYPADPGAVDGILAHLSLPSATGSKDIHILDPCCGKGAAINQIAEGLEIPQHNVYAIELDGNRVEEAKALMPEANVVGPASFFGMKMTGHTFSLAYVNPPFDSELGGGRREEKAFVEETYRLLTPGGTLVLVCPLNALNGNRSFCEYLDTRFENIRVYQFPAHLRDYREIVVIATKRRGLLSVESTFKTGELHRMDFQFRTQTDWWKILTCVGSDTYNRIVGGKIVERIAGASVVLKPDWKPSTFQKSAYLPRELRAALDKSPLNKLLAKTKPWALARPPLPPGKGHVALLLASGMLDGVVEAPDGNHVVRGTSKKVEFYNEAASTSEENPETGALTTKAVYSQRVVLVIRAAWPDGSIVSYSDQPTQDDSPDVDVPEEVRPHKYEPNADVAMPVASGPLPWHPIEDEVDPDFDW